MNILSAWLAACQNSKELNNLVVDLYKRKCEQFYRPFVESEVFITEDSNIRSISDEARIYLPTGIIKLCDTFNNSEETTTKEEISKELNGFHDVLVQYLENPEYPHTVSSDEEVEIINELVMKYEQQVHNPVSLKFTSSLTASINGHHMPPL